ncbi:B3 domain-containing protein Os11g0197600-like [Macadamia integrifolia]|uniref:B3 domain-containing protein Os11g0197600-like n=1 Tax=Macadamia integrifolia TaxID=60698 RepID=UPI001C4EC994|nr:B3 domain-containing protein Os11g0197600-like [Macadamia integrifolia]
MGENCEAEHLYWTQFQVKRFCRVMSSAFHQHLSIPSRFLQCLKDDLSLTDSLLCGRAILKGPSSKTWEMELIRTQDGLFFQNGWSDFVRDHNLQEGNILFFMYNGNLNFHVLIFDHESFCEKPCSYFMCHVSQRSLNLNHPPHVVQATSSSQQPYTLPTPAPAEATNSLNRNDPSVEATRSLNMNDPPSKTTSSPEQAHTLPTPAAASQPEPPSPLQPSTSQHIPSEPISGKRKLTIDVLEIESSTFMIDTSSTDDDAPTTLLSRPQSDDQFDLCHEKAKLEAKQKALQAQHASRFESVSVPMKRSSVSSRSQMTIPCEFVRKHFPPRNIEVTLCCGQSRRNVAFLYRKSLAIGAFTRGWAAFVNENHIVEDDVCLFELLCNGVPVQETKKKGNGIRVQERKRKGNGVGEEVDHDMLFNVRIFRVVKEDSGRRFERGEASSAGGRGRDRGRENEREQRGGCGQGEGEGIVQSNDRKHVGTYPQPLNDHGRGSGCIFMT